MNNKRFFAEQTKSMVKVAVELETETAPKSIEDCFKQEPISNNLLAWAVKLDLWSKTSAVLISVAAVIVTVCRIVGLVLNLEVWEHQQGEKAAMTLATAEFIDILLGVVYFVIVGVAVNVVFRIAAALMSNAARKTQLKWAQVRMEEYKLRMMEKDKP